MRLFATFVLCALAIFSAVIASVQFSENSLSKFFGDPPLEKGTRLYEFDPYQTARITLQQSPSSPLLTLERRNGLWTVTAPYTDRADPRIAGYLLAYSRNLIVEEAIPRKEIDSLSALGFNDDSPRVTLYDNEGEKQAAFKIGANSPWELYDEKNKVNAPTAYILPAEDTHRKSLYLCGSPDRDVFSRNFALLRDHRPLLFSPDALSKVLIKHKNATITLSRETPQSPWRISKPIELRTDPVAVKTLLQSLQQLTATQVTERGESSLPIADAKDQLSITLHPFGPQNAQSVAGETTLPLSTTLIVHPPNNGEAKRCLAETSDRPNTQFALPLLTINRLPLSVNQLRDRTLTGIQIKEINELSVSTPSSPPIRLSLVRNNNTSELRWMKGPVTRLELANEESIANLFTALTRDKAEEIVSDNLTDLAPYGLDQPSKTISITTANSTTPILLTLGEADDNYYAHLRGTTSVLRISPETYQRVTTRPYQWKDKLLWHFPIVDLTHLIIQRQGQPSLILEYNFLTERWKANQNGKDLTATLNQNRANKLLDFLEGARVEKWLGAKYPPARIALEAPVFKLAARFKPTDAHPQGHTVTFQLARGTQRSTNSLFYAQTNASPYYATIDHPSAERLAVDLFQK